MSMTHHIQGASDSLPVATYTATGATVVFWGMHVSDIAVLLSAAASVMGVCLQFYLAMSRIRRLERRQDAHIQVTGAVAEAVRVVDKAQKETK